MSKTVIHTDLAPKAVGPYSQAVIAGGFVFCSGQIAIDPSTNQVLDVNVQEQTRQCFSNAEAVLKEAGCDFSNVVKTTVFLTDMNDFAQVNEIYASYFSDLPPARSCVQVSGLPKGVQVEVEILALKSSE